MASELALKEFSSHRRRSIVKLPRKSGKTAALVEQLRRDLSSGRVAPRDVVLVARFTREFSSDLRRTLRVKIVSRSRSSEPEDWIHSAQRKWIYVDEPFRTLSAPQFKYLKANAQHLCAIGSPGPTGSW